MKDRYFEITLANYTSENVPEVVATVICKAHHTVTTLIAKNFCKENLSINFEDVHHVEEITRINALLLVDDESKIRHIPVEAFNETTNPPFVWVVWGKNDDTHPFICGIGSTETRADKIIDEMTAVFEDTLEYEKTRIQLDHLNINHKDIFVS